MLATATTAGDEDEKKRETEETLELAKLTLAGGEYGPKGKCSGRHGAWLPLILVRCGGSQLREQLPDYHLQLTSFHLTAQPFPVPHHSSPPISSLLPIFLL